MEAWLKAQEVAISLNESAHLPRPSSAPLEAFSRPSLLISAGTASTPVSPVQPLASAHSPSQTFSVTTAVAGDAASAYSHPGSSPFRGSFLAGANQDLLAAGALASCGILNSSLVGRYTLLGAKVGMSPAASMPATVADNIGAYSIGASTAAAAAPGASLTRIPVPLVSSCCWLVGLFVVDSIACGRHYAQSAQNAYNTSPLACRHTPVTDPNASVTVAAAIAAV